MAAYIAPAGSVERADNGFAAEASTLQLAPGQFPEAIILGEDVFTRRRLNRNGEGELTSVEYQNGWRILTVWND